MNNTEKLMNIINNNNNYNNYNIQKTKYEINKELLINNKI